MKISDRIVYQIYPRSFMDTDGDGFGDIRGIISRLDHLQDLGINTIWLSPVYKSPGFDNGYDISDYKSIDPLFGTMDDMEHLISQAKKRGIGIIMDLVINHTSNKHEWFIQSKDPYSPYANYYFWDRRDKEDGPPNNWTSFFGGGAWSYDDEAKGYYLHLFASQQPDLNYHEPKVLEEIKDVLRFWLDKGIAGFRCDVINIIWKDSLENGKRRLILKGIEHYLTKEGTHRILRQIHEQVLSKYDAFTVGETVFVDIRTARDLSSVDRKELDMVFSFEHMETDQVIVKWFKTRFRPKKFFRTISKWQQGLEWNANYLENHDQPRSVSRFIRNDRYRVEGAKALAMLLLTLRGTPFIYQGQEIGMTNFDITSMEDIRDVESKNIYSLARKIGFPKRAAWNLIRKTSRDNARTPMQWDNEEKPSWIKMNANYEHINVKDQQPDPDSVLSFYKKIIALRKELPELKEGRFKEIKITNRIFVYSRSLNAKADIVIAINLSGKSVNFKCDKCILLSTYDRKDYNDKILPYEGILFKGDE